MIVGNVAAGARKELCDDCMKSSKMSMGVDDIIIGNHEVQDARKGTNACLSEAIGVGRRNSEMAKRDKMAISGKLAGEGKVVEDGRNGSLRS